MRDWKRELEAYEYYNSTRYKIISTLISGWLFGMGVWITIMFIHFLMFVFNITELVA
jgi:hypothetical protein